MKAPKIGNIQLYSGISESRLKIKHPGKSLSSAVNSTKPHHSNLPSKEALEYAITMDNETKLTKKLFQRVKSSKPCLNIADSYSVNKNRLSNQRMDRIKSIEPSTKVKLSQNPLLRTREPITLQRPPAKTGQNKSMSVSSIIVRKAPKGYMNKFQRIDEVINKEIDIQPLVKEEKLDHTIRYNEKPQRLDVSSSFAYITKRTAFKVSQMPKNQIRSLLNQDQNTFNRFFSQSVAREEFYKASRKFASIG